MDQFISYRPYQLKLEDDQETPGKQILSLTMVRSVPANMALIIGDIIHNLRVSLDLLATDLVRINNKSPRKVYFPFANSKSEIDKQIKDKNFHRASDEAIALLRDAIKPFGGDDGNGLLYALHNADIMDKHKLLIPVAMNPVIPRLLIRTPEGGMACYDYCTWGSLPNFRFSKGSTVETPEPIFPEFHFGADLPSVLRTASVLEVISNLLIEVDGIVQTFKALYPGQFPDIVIEDPVRPVSSLPAVS